jgi:hypothetical protein
MMIRIHEPPNVYWGLFLREIRHPVSEAYLLVLLKHNRSLMVAVQGPEFWPFPYTYIYCRYLVTRLRMRGGQEQKQLPSVKEVETEAFSSYFSFSPLERLKVTAIDCRIHFSGLFATC